MVRLTRPLLSTSASNSLPRPPPALNTGLVTVKGEYPVGVDIIAQHNPSGRMPKAGPASSSSQQPPNANGTVDKTKKPPRPPNAWILYRSDRLKELARPKPGEPKTPQAEISKSISQMWRTEAEEVKKKYERMAEYAKAQHALMYPNYRFAPMKKADKEKIRKEEKEEKAKQKAAEKRAKQRPGPYYIPLLHNAAKEDDDENDGMMPTVLDPMSYSPPISCANTPEPVYDDLPSPDDGQSPASLADERALRLPPSMSKGQEPMYRHQPQQEPQVADPAPQWPPEDPVAANANFEGPTSWTANGILPDGPGNLDFAPSNANIEFDWSSLQSIAMPDFGLPPQPNFDFPPPHLDIDFSLFPSSVEAQNGEPSQHDANVAENFLHPFNLDMFDDVQPPFPSLLEGTSQQQWDPLPSPSEYQPQHPGPHDQQQYEQQPYPHPHELSRPEPHGMPTQAYPSPYDAPQQQQQQQQQQQPQAAPRQLSGDMMQYLSFDNTGAAAGAGDHSFASGSMPSLGHEPVQTEGERQRMSSVATITTERYHRLVSGGSEAPSPSSLYAPSPLSRYSHEPSPAPPSSSYAPSPVSPYPPAGFPPPASYSHQPSPASFSHQPLPTAYSQAQYAPPHVQRSTSSSSVASSASVHSQTALQPTQPQPYAPPAGASKVGSRRVGGRWAYPTQ